MAMLLGAGMIVQAVEALYVPPVMIPGAKLGLANSVTVLVVALFGWREVMIHVATRVIAVSFITGTFMSTTFVYSLAGGLLSAVFMLIVYNALHGTLSYAGISVVGAQVHNLTQMGLAILILGHIGVVMLLPWLIVIATFTGLANGLLVNVVGPRIQVISAELQRG